MPAIDVVVTDFGPVKIGKNAAQWVEEPKRKKDKKERMRRLEEAVSVMAHLEWRTGGVLEKLG